MQTIRAASVQFESVQADKDANLHKIAAFVEAAAAQSIQLLVFPECCITGYWFLRKLSREQLLHLAEPARTGPSSVRLLDLASRYGMSIGAGLVELGADGLLYNSYLVAMPNGELRCHRKLHAFENEHISSGSEFTVFNTPHGCRFGVLICYDNNLIENVRITALLGADVLLAPHQTGGCAGRDPHQMGVIRRELWDHRRENPEAIEREILGDKGRGWLMRWLPGRAHDNGIFLVFSNGIGVDDDEIRTGNAMILDPYGRILAESRKADDDMVIAELCGNLVAKNTGRNWLQARRPELYAPLTARYGNERDARELKFEE